MRRCRALRYLPGFKIVLASLIVTAILLGTMLTFSGTAYLFGGSSSAYVHDESGSYYSHMSREKVSKVLR